MADCQSLATCIFFNDKMAKMPETAKYMKKKYCMGDYSVCARYAVSSKLGKDSVPVDLFPNDAERAKEILAKG